ncbi:unnamed protein product [Dicrocoelium dendriticum]|nr:unnamed protein product [Dicrocoelium dendriticum]
MVDADDDLNVDPLPVDPPDESLPNGSSASHSKKEKKKCKKRKPVKRVEKMEVEPEQSIELEDEPKAYIPGRSRPLMQDEELVMDKSSYRMFYQLQVESSCLSFDLLLDNLGSNREIEVNGPATSTCMITGTQASRGMKNSLVVMRLDNLKPFSRKAKPEGADADHESETDESSSDEEDLDAQPDLEAATINHEGTVNRTRARQHGGRYLAASWSEAGKSSPYQLTLSERLLMITSMIAISLSLQILYHYSHC